MCAKPDQPERRERAFAQLVAGALKPGRSTGAADAACPDAEIVAAYADRGLADSERVELETHFAACERCQKVLAALGVGLEAAVGESVAVMPAPAAPHVAARPSSSSQRWLWWLTPAFGAAAAALLWMVLRPASPSGTAVVQTAANYSQPAEEASRALDAQDTLSSRAAAPAAVPRRDAQALDDLSKAKSAAKENDEPARKQASTPPALPGTERAPAAVSEARNVAGAPQDAFAQTMIAPAPAAPAAGPLAAAPPAARDQAVAANQQASLQARSMAAVAAPAARQSAAAPAQADRGAAVDVNLYTFSPPDGSATWRLGIGGRIERSTDRGRTWQPQSSGVTTDLIAGSASSSDVAWVIGRGGVILRSTDGEHWERIVPPAGVTVEWAAIAAHDAMSATAVAADLRRFSTGDGGRTWTQQR